MYKQLLFKALDNDDVAEQDRLIRLMHSFGWDKYVSELVEEYAVMNYADINLQNIAAGE